MCLILCLDFLRAFALYVFKFNINFSLLVRRLGLTHLIIAYSMSLAHSKCKNYIIYLHLPERRRITCIMWSPIVLQLLLYFLTCIHIEKLLKLLSHLLLANFIFTILLKLLLFLKQFNWMLGQALNISSTGWRGRPKKPRIIFWKVGPL